ncbi:MAG: prepilin-type N-terminal cleavage/methylation domain-containing protein [Peptostreptococcaceae bacterium]|nr:prepilin-type N-terminal cleavage/methylation domain-containing protein [Peptostreptococcaceae bacterium]
MYHKKSGFTLIEILIVVTILLSLTFIGAIKYIDVVEENNINLDIVNARTIAEGIKMAGLAGAIDLKTNVSNAPITGSALEKYIDTDITPKSKKYLGTERSGFVYSIKDQKITISANSHVVYPQPKAKSKD